MITVIAVKYMQTENKIKKNFIEKIYIIWYDENNSEMKTDSVTAKDRHVINSSPLQHQRYIIMYKLLYE